MKKILLLLLAVSIFAGAFDLQAGTGRRKKFQVDEKDKDLCMSNLKSFYGSLKLYASAMLADRDAVERSMREWINNREAI